MRFTQKIRLIMPRDGKIQRPQRHFSTDGLKYCCQRETVHKFFTTQGVFLHVSSFMLTAEQVLSVWLEIKANFVFRMLFLTHFSLKRYLRKVVSESKKFFYFCYIPKLNIHFNKWFLNESYRVACARLSDSRDVAKIPAFFTLLFTAQDCATILEPGTG